VAQGFLLFVGYAEVQQRLLLLLLPRLPLPPLLPDWSQVVLRPLALSAENFLPFVGYAEALQLLLQLPMLPLLLNWD
jgi:hypothetical protein